MNTRLGMRTLALLAFVAASTVVIVQPDLIGGAAPALLSATNTLPVLGH